MQLRTPLPLSLESCLGGAKLSLRQLKFSKETGDSIVLKCVGVLVVVFLPLTALMDDFPDVTERENQDVPSSYSWAPSFFNARS